MVDSSGGDDFLFPSLLRHVGLGNPDQLDSPCQLISKTYGNLQNLFNDSQLSDSNLYDVELFFSNLAVVGDSRLALRCFDFLGS